MGDRCYISVTLRRVDLLSLTEILQYGNGLLSSVEECLQFYDDTEDYYHANGEPSSINVVCHEANYAWHDPLTEFSLTGATFYGFHSSGDTYHPGLFASFDYKISFVSCDFGNHTPLMEVFSGGVFDIEALRRIEMYHRLFSLAFSELRGIYPSFLQPLSPHPLKLSSGFISTEFNPLSKLRKIRV